MGKKVARFIFKPNAKNFVKKKEKEGYTVEKKKLNLFSTHEINKDVSDYKGKDGDIKTDYVTVFPRIYEVVYWK